ncbi:MAG: phosphatidate cytidylyltransferase [Gammaproteobacteria bacterium]
MLKQRIITSVIVLPLVIAALIFLNDKHFAMLTAIFIGFAGWEWLNLIECRELWQRWLYVFLLLATCMGSFFYDIALWILPLGFILWVFALIWISRYPGASQWWRQWLLLRAMVGWILLSLFWFSVNSIRQSDLGVVYLLSLCAIIWCADSVAYFTGKQWGKTPLAERLSPGKTWEGLYGGIIAGVLCAVVAGFFIGVAGTNWILWLLLVMMTLLFSVVGDLFESMCKRIQGRKDSGNWFPGHGGLLDRIDSLTAAAPVYGAGLWLIHNF